MNLIAIDTPVPQLQHLLLDEGQSAAAFPPGAPLLGQQGLVAVLTPVAVVILGKGLAAGPMELVEVLDETELRMLLGLDQFVLADEEPKLLNVVPLQGEILPVVPHLRLQTDCMSLYQSVNELPNIYKNDIFVDPLATDIIVEQQHLLHLSGPRHRVD